ncbi:MAG: S49 family peptidase, partial [Thermoflexales bacterium]
MAAARPNPWLLAARLRTLPASGGYYVSMAADHIVAHPDTLTGSI